MTETTRPAPIASTRHTLIILGILLGITLVNARRTGGAPLPVGAESRFALYGILLGVEWLLFYGVWRGLKAHGTSLSSVFGDVYRTRRGRIVTVAGGLAAFAVLALVVYGVKEVLRRLGAPVDADTAQVHAAMAPHGLAQALLWVALSISAGVCEEFVYRGYLLTQFSAWLGGRVPGVLVSALVFGLGHTYQGPWQVILIAVGYGIPMGVLAILARSLGPPVVAHALTDIVSGLAGY